MEWTMDYGLWTMDSSMVDAAVQVTGVVTLRR